MPPGSRKDTTGFSGSLLAESEMTVVGWRAWWEDKEYHCFTPDFYYPMLNMQNIQQHIQTERWTD